MIVLTHDINFGISPVRRKVNVFGATFRLISAALVSSPDRNASLVGEIRKHGLRRLPRTELFKQDVADDNDDDQRYAVLEVERDASV